MGYNNEGYLIRAERIKEITDQYYEPENQAKCYKQVWRKHIYPLFGIKYKSYLRYLRANQPKVQAPERLPSLFDEDELNY